MTVHRAGKIQSISHSTDTVRDADARDPSTTCGITLTRGPRVVTCPDESTAEHVAQVTCDDATGTVARAAILDATGTGRAEDPDRPRSCLTARRAPLLSR